MDDPCLSPSIDTGPEAVNAVCCFHDGARFRTLCLVAVLNALQLPELMLLRGMHDSGCEEIFIIVTDLKRQEMDEVTEYFKLVCRHSFGRTSKPSMERRIQYEREWPLSHVSQR